MIIRGRFVGDAPYFAVHLHAAHFHGLVWLLADTGASRTTLLDRDVRLLGIPPAALEPAAQTDFWFHTGLTNHPILCLSTNSQGHVFAGTADSGIFRSTDHGERWNNVILFRGRVETVATKDSCVLGGFFAGGMVRSTDNGTS